MTIFAGFNFVAAETVGDVAPIATQRSTLNADMFFTVAVGRGVPDRNRDRVLKSGAPEMARLGRDRDRSRRDNPAGFFGFLGLGVWTVVASVMLAMRAGDTGQDAAPRPAG